MKKSRKKRLLITGIIVVALIFIFVLTVTILNFISDNKLKDKLCELRKKGYPTTGKELNEWYKKVPKEENAALIYEKALKIFEKEKDKKTLMIFQDYKDKPAPNEVLDEISAYLAKHKKILSLLEDASKLSKNRYSIDFENENISSAMLPNAYELHNCLKLLSLKLFYDVENKKYDNIKNILYQQIKLSNSLENSPVLIHSLVQIAFTQIFLKNIKMLISKGVITSNSQIDKIKSLISQINCQNVIKNGFIGELVFGNEVAILTANAPLSIFSSEKTSGFVNFFIKLLYNICTINDHYMMISFCEKWRNLSDEKHNINLIQKTEKVHQEIENICKSSFRFNHLLFKMMMPSLLGLIKKQISVNTHKRMILTALELERFNLKNKKYPDNIKDIISKDFPVLLLDPFSDKPLKYIKINDSSYKLYSFSYNMIDDNGVHKSKNGTLEKGDFVLFIK